MVNVQIKTAEEIEKMRVAGRLAASVLSMIESHIDVGVTTDALNSLCHAFIVDELDAIPAPLNYRGFPKSICTSVNEVVCHGIPDHKRLKNGDIINVDVTVIKDGYHGDTSKMFYVGEPSILAKQLCTVCRECLFLGIDAVRAGAHLGDIGAAIQRHAHAHGYSVVRDYCGHGIGAQFHESPNILHFGEAGKGLEMVEGMTFTIEPMINAGKYQTKTKKDGWTAVTKDRQLSAQWEHTLLVTANGCDILTLRDGEQRTVA